MKNEKDVLFGLVRECLIAVKVLNDLESRSDKPLVRSDGSRDAYLNAVRWVYEELKPNYTYEEFCKIAMEWGEE